MTAEGDLEPPGSGGEVDVHYAWDGTDEPGRVCVRSLYDGSVGVLVVNRESDAAIQIMELHSQPGETDILIEGLAIEYEGGRATLRIVFSEHQARIEVCAEDPGKLKYSDDAWWRARCSVTAEAGSEILGCIASLLKR